MRQGGAVARLRGQARDISIQIVIIYAAQIQKRRFVLCRTCHAPRALQVATAVS